MAAPSVVVANPGGQVWVRPLAEALARAGMLGEYLAPVAINASGLAHRAGQLPGFVVRQLERRVVGDDVPGSATRSVATAHELLFVAAQRLGLPDERLRTISHWRLRRFDAAVARHLRNAHDGVVAYAGGAARTLERGNRLGMKGFLDYPIAHHDVCERLMQEEARLQPAYAGTLQGHDYPPRYRRQLDAEVERADHILVLCAFHRDSFLEAGVPPQKLTMNPLGVDVELFRPRLRAEDGTFRVLFSGQITQRKGISYLVEGFRRAAIPRSELVFVGRPVGTAEPWIREPGVHHVPAVARTDLPDLYGKADAFAMPSLVEGFGLTALEAMAMGLPVILTPNTFGPDLLSDGEDGYIVPVRDADAIAERLLALHRDRDLARRIGRAARATAAGYGWDSYGNRMVEAIRDRAGVSP
jgi:alpha-maltose-1-phosphate synthase